MYVIYKASDQIIQHFGANLWYSIVKLPVWRGYMTNPIPHKPDKGQKKMQNHENVWGLVRFMFFI